MSGCELIVVERQRQQSVGGWTALHDDGHTGGELGDAAVAYVRAATSPARRQPSYWPWEARWWKPSDDPVRNLIKAGALIAAEIDRLQRLRRHNHD